MYLGTTEGMAVMMIFMIHFMLYMEVEEVGLEKLVAPTFQQTSHNAFRVNIIQHVEDVDMGGQESITLQLMDQLPFFQCFLVVHIQA